MTDTTTTTNVYIYRTPQEIWDALARVCRVNEGRDGIAWVSFTAHGSGAEIQFFHSKPASDVTPASSEDVPF